MSALTDLKLQTCLCAQTHYSDGDYIIRQGATGDTFFIISKGQVRKKDEIEEEKIHEEVVTMRRVGGEFLRGSRNQSSFSSISVKFNYVSYIKN